MKKIVILFFLSCVSMFSTAQIAIPIRQEFINYWVQFKNALKFNDADFLFSSVQVPFVGEGSYYNPEAELDEIRAELMRIKVVPAKGMNKRVTGHAYRTGVEVTIGNDGEAIFVNIRKSKTTAGEVIAREVYAGRNATANNADRALVKALKKAEVKLSQYKL